MIEKIDNQTLKDRFKVAIDQKEVDGINMIILLKEIKDRLVRVNM